MLYHEAKTPEHCQHITGITRPALALSWPKCLRQKPEIHTHRILSWIRSPVFTVPDSRAGTTRYEWCTTEAGGGGTFHLTWVNEAVPLKRIYFLERSSVFYWTVNFATRYSTCQTGTMVTLITIICSSNLT